MGSDESKKNEMKANAKEFNPTSSNGQNSYSYSQAPAANGWTMSYGATMPVGNAWLVNPQPPQIFPASPDWQNSYPYGQAPAANGWTMSYGATMPVGNAWFGNPPQSYSTTFPVVNARPVNPSQSYIIPQIFPTSPNGKNSYSHVPAPATNGGGFRSGNLQSQQTYTAEPIKFMKKDLFLEKELPEFLLYNKVSEPSLVLFPYYEETRNLIDTFDYEREFTTCKKNSGSSKTFKLSRKKQNSWEAAKDKYLAQVKILENHSKDWKNIENKKLSPEEEKKEKKAKTEGILEYFISKYNTADAVQMSLCFDIYNEGFKECVNEILGSDEIEPKYDAFKKAYKEKLEEQKNFATFEKELETYDKRVNKLQGYSTQWRKLRDNQSKEKQTKKILEDFIFTYNTADAVQMSLCYAIYNKDFKECVNKILDTIKPKEEDYEKKEKYDAFKKAYKEKLEEQENFATFEKELKTYDIVPSVEIATTHTILKQGYINNTSMNLEAQELFYFASNIFKSLYVGKNEDDEFMIFFSNYIETIRNTDTLGEARKPIADKLETLQKNMASNFSTKPKAEIIYTVLNGLANALPYKDIIEQIWNGHFLSKYYKNESDATKSRIKLNLIESTLTGNLVIYKTQGLQSALYDYLTPENSYLTKEELDIRKKLLTEANTRGKLEDFKKNTLVPKLLEQRPELEKEYKIDDDALVGILSLAANNGINISLDDKDLNSRISNYISRVSTKKRNNIEALSNIIYTMLYHSDTETLLKQDNGIIKELKTKLGEIKEGIDQKITNGEECEPYLFYNVITIDKFMDYYESKKSKRQLLESVKSAEQEIEQSAPQSESQIVFDNKCLDKLRENFTSLIQDRSFTFNKGKAIITFIKYYASKLGTEAKQEQLKGLKQDLETQLKENAEKKGLIEDLIGVLENVSTDEPENSKGGTESRFDTVSQFESCIKGIIKETFKATEDTTDTQYQIKDRKVDFHIAFKEDCSIEIADDFIIPIKAGTEIVIEADGATHFEKDISPKNLKEAQDAITGKTRERNYEIKEALIDNKDPDSLKERVSVLRDKEDQLLNLACYLQGFRQRRKHLDPTIYSDLFKEFYGPEEEIENHTASDAINLSGNIPQPQELQELKGQLSDHKDIISESIKKSNLFFSIPLLEADIRGDGYPKEKIKKVFLNCFINAYCSQALSNLKEFYRWKAEEEKKELENRRKAEEEKKELENTETTQSSQQKQNGDQATRQGENGRLASFKVVGNYQTNKKIGGIDALKKIKEARDQEKEKMKPKLDSMPTIPQKTQTSGQGNVLP